MRFYRQNENNFTSGSIKNEVSISVDSEYWFNKLERTLQDLADLYNKLFPSPQCAAHKDLDVKAHTVTVITARRLWRSIRDNPQSPPGPLTLAAVCMAFLMGANFADPRDRRVFFEFMEHNKDFREFFHWGMRDKNVRANAKVLAKQLHDDLGYMVPTVEEALRLAKIWGGLYTKIANAARGEDSEFYRELFEFAPTVARCYSTAPDAVPSLKWLALRNPGVVAAAVLGFEQSPGYLNAGFALQEIEELLTQTIHWVNVSVSDEWVSGDYDIRTLYQENPFDPAAFIAQLEPSKLNLSDEGPFSTVFHMPGPQEPIAVMPSPKDVNKMFEKIATLLNNGIRYFFRYRPAVINAIFSKIANAHLSSENDVDRQRYLELRYRLYHPATIKAMAGFWLENFESFKQAAGKNDEYLAHLLRHMPDPADFILRMLDKKPTGPNGGDHAERWDYFEPRFVKILPALVKTLGSRGQKKLEELMVKKMKRGEENHTVFEAFQTQTKQLMVHYARHFQDPDEQLLAVLNEKSTRDICLRSADQVIQCLRSKTPNDPKTYNSRFEVIIAGDDRLFDMIEPVDPRKIKAYYPTLWARYVLTAQDDLRAYVKASRVAPMHLKPGERTRMLSVREAYVIAANESFWHEIDPYARHPFRTFFEWLIPGSQQQFFDKAKTKLMEKNPILGFRMDWAQDQSKRFEEFLVDQQQSILGKAQLPSGTVIPDQVKEDFAALVADLGRGSALFELYKGGKLAVPKNPCRAKAFLAEVNTPKKVSDAYDFIMEIDTAYIDAEAVFRLMIRDESPTQAEKNSGKTCFGLAKSLIDRKPAMLPEIVALFKKKGDELHPEVWKHFAVDIIMDKNLPLAYQGREGIGCDQAIRDIIAPGTGKKNLTADDLLRIKNVSQTVFGELMSDQALRTKLTTRLDQMTGPELTQVGVMGLGALFKTAPDCLHRILLKLPSFDAPETVAAEDKDDIFMLNPPTVWGQSDLSQQPLFIHMMIQGIGTKENFNLVMRCMQCSNAPLKRLMCQLFSGVLAQADLRKGPILLLKFLKHNQSNPALIENIIAKFGTLKDEIRNLLLSPVCIDHLKHDDKKPPQFSISATKLWPVLLKSPAIQDFIDKLPLNDPNEEIRKAAHQWFQCSTLFGLRMRQKVEASSISVSESMKYRVDLSRGNDSNVSFESGQNLQLSRNSFQGIGE